MQPSYTQYIWKNLWGFTHLEPKVVSRMLTHFTTKPLDIIIQQYHYCIDGYLFHKTDQTYEKFYLHYGVQTYHSRYERNLPQYTPEYRYTLSLYNIPMSTCYHWIIIPHNILCLVWSFCSILPQGLYHDLLPPQKRFQYVGINNTLVIPIIKNPCVFL